MPVLAALFLAVQAQPTLPTPAYPSGDVLAAFADGCDWSLDGTTPPASANGGVAWTPVRAQASGRIARHVARLRGARVFQARAGGRRLYLILTARSDISGRSCRVIDFSGGAPIALSDLVPWAGRLPDGEVGGYGEARWGRYWAPGLFDGHRRTEIYHIPAGSPLAASDQLRGLVLTTYTGTTN